MIENFRIGAGAVQRLLDRQHLGVAGRFRQQVDHRRETFERMVQQDIALIDGFENTLVFFHRRRQPRAERRVVQAWPVHAGEHARQIHRAVDLVGVLLGQFELFQQVLDQIAGAVVGHFQAHLVTVAARQQLALQRAGQVFHVLVHFQVGVPRDPELVAAGGFHAGEQIADVGVDHRRQENKVVVAVLADFFRQPHQTRQRAWRRHDGQTGGAAERVLAVQRHDEIQALVHQPREGVRRVQGDGRQHRVNLVAEVLFHPLGLRRRPVLAAQEVHAFLGQGRQQDVLQDVVLTLHGVVGHAGDLGEHFLGEHAIRARAPGAGFQAVLQARHANLEELVHVGREDQQEIETLHQRMMLVHGLLEHP